jgi:hypothetical protein
MPFELGETVASLDSFTGRVQKSGPDDVPAVSINLSFQQLPNTVLDTLNPELCPTFWLPPVGKETQETIPGERQPLTRLRCRDVGTVELPTKLEGWVVDILCGIDPPQRVRLPKAKIDRIRFTPSGDGRIDLAMRVGTSAVEPEDVGALWALQKQDIRIVLTPPRSDPSPAPASAPASAPAAAPADVGAQLQLGEDVEDATQAIIGRLMGAPPPPLPGDQAAADGAGGVDDSGPQADAPSP